MGKVLAGITMSLDGFVTGRTTDSVLGSATAASDCTTGSSAALALRRRRRVGADVDKQYIEETFASAGAWLVGRTMHDVVDGWGDDPGFGVPVYVVTHRPHETLVKGDTTFEFVTDGIDTALEKARAAAGEWNVLVMGGADLLRQYLDAGVVDELTRRSRRCCSEQGKRLFDGIARTDLEFERTAVIESPYATHLRYRVRV